MTAAARRIEIAEETLSHAEVAYRVSADLPGIGFPLVCALLDMESEGANVYGHDVDGALSGFYFPVTEDNYRVFYWLVDAKGMKSNGVGPCQITYWGYHEDMRKRGLRCWDPYDNIRYGADILARNLINRRLAGAEGDRLIAEAATLYNAGNLRNGVNDYGRKFVEVAKHWRGRLA